MDKSFVGVLGTSPRVKIWEFLIIGRAFEYHIKDIAKGANISRPTCHAEIKKLSELGIVKKGKKYKGKQLYTLNKSSDTVKRMFQAFRTIVYK